MNGVLLIYCFVSYKIEISEKDLPTFDKLVGYAIKYFKDVIITSYAKRPLLSTFKKISKQHFSKC